MAKNRDRRREHKSEDKSGVERPPLRRARPDLLIRVGNAVFQGYDWRYRAHNPMQIAKALGEHVDDVDDCLQRMVHDGRLRRDGRLYRCAPSAPPPPPVPKPQVDPDVLLRVRKVFERIGKAKIEDFGRRDSVPGVLSYLLAQGYLFKLNDGTYIRNQSVQLAQARVSGSATSAPKRRLMFEWRTKGECPWCSGKTRRHARSEVHDPEACRQRMITNIMSG